MSLWRNETMVKNEEKFLMVKSGGKKIRRTNPPNPAVKNKCKAVTLPNIIIRLSAAVVNGTGPLFNWISPEKVTAVVSRVLYTLLGFSGYSFHPVTS
jgi:hypothetical protein